VKEIKLPNDVPVQSPHDADARHHGRAGVLYDQQHGFDRGLPFREILFGLGKLHGGMAQSHQLAPTRQQDRIIETTGPGGSELRSCDQLSAFRDVLSAQAAFFSAASTAHFLGADCSAFLTRSRSSFNSEI
jgi:hypothetical protein